MSQYQAGAGSFTLAITGESVITTGLSFREPQFLALRELLHSADARFTNAEMLLHNCRTVTKFVVCLIESSDHMTRHSAHGRATRPALCHFGSGGVGGRWD